MYWFCKKWICMTERKEWNFCRIMMLTTGRSLAKTTTPQKKKKWLRITVGTTMGTRILTLPCVLNTKTSLSKTSRFSIATEGDQIDFCWSIMAFAWTKTNTTVFLLEFGWTSTSSKSKSQFKMMNTMRKMITGSKSK